MTPQSQDYFFVGVQLVLLVVFPLDINALLISIPVWLQYCGVILTISGVVLSGSALLQLNTKLSPFPTPKKGVL